MSILNKLLNEIGTSEFDEQVRKICDIITEEERPKDDEVEYLGPVGPNVFLSIEVNEDIKFKGNYCIKNFITLEREQQQVYVIRHWTRRHSYDKSQNLYPLKLKENWVLKKENRDKPEKILKEFAERLQYMKGE